MGVQKLKSVVIDDSEIQRVTLTRLIEKHTDLVFEGSYRSAIRAKTNDVGKVADLIFLDIEMPLINGFDFLESLEERPQVIIISTKADYALRAFDYNVTDYLLKPIATYRFDKAVKKAMIKAERTWDSDNGAHIFVKSNFRRVKVNYKDIKWIEALGDYIRVITEKSNLVVLTSMKAFDDQLPDDQFLRIHKSYIINLKRIEKFNNTIVEIDGKKMPLSRKRKSRFFDALGVD